MASAFLQSAFRHAHDLIREEFADAEIFAWFRTVRDDEDSAWVAVVCQRGALRTASAGLGGMVTMDTDGIVINAHKDAFPWPPQTGDVFLLGPAVTTGGTTPAADLPSYCIRPGMVSADIMSIYHIIADKHS